MWGKIKIQRFLIHHHPENQPNDTKPIGHAFYTSNTKEEPQDTYLHTSRHLKQRVSSIPEKTKTKGSNQSDKNDLIKL